MKTALRKASRRDDRAYKEFLLHVLPDQGNWTEEKYLWLTDCTTRLIELTDGYIEVLPMPTDRHQAISAYLFKVLDVFFLALGGIVRYAPLRLRIREGKFREPDLLAVKKAKESRRQNRYWTGADFALEVVCDDNPERDLIHKRHDFAACGVPEYWIVNPEKETILVLFLNGKRYKKHGEFGRGEIATSVTLAGFSVRVDDVFDAQ